MQFEGRDWSESPSCFRQYKVMLGFFLTKLRLRIAISLSQLKLLSPQFEAGGNLRDTDDEEPVDAHGGLHGDVPNS
jgi:hypothetical protein